MDTFVLWLTAAVAGLAAFTGWLVKWALTHLESDLNYSRRGHERGTAATEKAVAVAERRAE